MNETKAPQTALYAGTIFLASFLLFLVEPIAAKQLLPALGGSAAVWMTCLVFFQLTLLLGYLYAHFLTLRHSAAQHLLVIGLASASAIIALITTIPVDPAHPIRFIFLTLATTIGLPFLLLSSTSPLLQVWLARTTSGAVPYRLFALSNVGSLLALFLYPTLIEPHLTLHHQRLLWTAGFLLYAALLTAITFKARAANETTTAVLSDPTPVEAAPSTLRQRLLWFLLPMAAAMQLTAVTGHLTENIAAIPLLWMLPLAAYLLSFILAFEYPALYSRGAIIRLLVVFLAALGYALSRTDYSLPIALSILFFLAECFVACYYCHAEVYSLKPHATSQATLFYLLIAAGGATGTFLIGIASPLLFSANYDLALAFFTTAALALAVTWNYGWSLRLLWATASILLFALLTMLHIAYSHDSLLLVRNFYGPLRVKQTLPAPNSNTPDTSNEVLRTLLNGNIQHGTQIFSPTLQHIPTTYYSPDSGIGLALSLCCENRPRSIGVIGLGAGTIAAYGRRNDTLRFYELNPAVQPIARNLFTYLRDTPASVTIVEGDARASLTSELKTAPQQFDVLAIDAFSGDAIPLHLLTTQAIALYRRHLKPNGILAFHVSNQYVDLAPEIALLAANAHLHAISINSNANTAQGAYASSWVLVTADPDIFTQIAITETSHPIPTDPNLRLWTDDYSSLLPLLRWGNTRTADVPSRSASPP
jgi:hypothetical protein